LYQEAALTGLAVFALVAALCVPAGAAAARSLARVARSLYASMLLGQPGRAAAAAAGLLLHAGLGLLAVGHMALLYGMLREPALVASALPLARASAWLVAAGSSLALLLRSAAAARGHPLGRCEALLDVLLLLASASALAWPWSWFHWAPGASAGALAAYMLARGHASRTRLLLSQRMLAV